MCERGGAFRPTVRPFDRSISSQRPTALALTAGAPPLVLKAARLVSPPLAWRRGSQPYLERDSDNRPINERNSLESQRDRRYKEIRPRFIHLCIHVYMHSLIPSSVCSSFRRSTSERTNERTNERTGRATTARPWCACRTGRRGWSCASQIWQPTPTSCPPLRPPQDSTA